MSFNTLPPHPQDTVLVTIPFLNEALKLDLHKALSYPHLVTEKPSKNLLLLRCGEAAG